MAFDLLLRGGIDCCRSVFFFLRSCLINNNHSIFKSVVLDLLACHRNGSRKTEGRKMFGYFTDMTEQQLLWTGQSSGAVL